ncbi:MAG: hypothetical protein P1P84_15490 [Deferrisomatales bacterium]|nr:hypothetical protein [Deferrisomatales bacterium]
MRRRDQAQQRAAAQQQQQYQQQQAQAQAATDAKQGEYRKAQNVCLEGRGYSVK